MRVSYYAYYGDFFKVLYIHILRGGGGGRSIKFAIMAVFQKFPILIIKEGGFSFIWNLRMAGSTKN